MQSGIHASTRALRHAVQYSLMDSAAAAGSIFPIVLTKSGGELPGYGYELPEKIDPGYEEIYCKRITTRFIAYHQITTDAVSTRESHTIHHIPLDSNPC